MTTTTILDGKFLTMTLEDGEKVARLVGGRGLERKSDRPHAGIWGPESSYVLIPCRTPRQTKNRAKVAVSSMPGLVNRSGEDAVVLLGPHDAIARLVEHGPAFCRGLRNRKGQPRTAAQQSATDRLKRRPA